MVYEYITNIALHKDLQILSIKEETIRKLKKFYSKLLSIKKKEIDQTNPKNDFPNQIQFSNKNVNFSNKKEVLLLIPPKVNQAIKLYLLIILFTY